MNHLHKDQKTQHFMQKRMYSVGFTATRKKICLSLHYNGDNGYLFVNGTEIIKFKAKDSQKSNEKEWHIIY